MAANKLLLIGHGRHGKDTVAEILRDYHGRSFRSSSHWAAEHVVFDKMRTQTGNLLYDNWEKCFECRHDARGTWFNHIRQFCVDNGGDAIAKGVLENSSIYVGMRSRLEYEASVHLFDEVVWVDRSDHLPDENPESMQLTQDDATIKVDNNGDLRDLWLEIDDLVMDEYI